MTLLGMDIGTNHAKARAYEREGRLLAGCHAITPTKRLPDGGADYEAVLAPSGQHAEHERLYAEVHEPLRALLRRSTPGQHGA